MNDLDEWTELTAKLVELKKKEMELRLKLFNHYFEDPIEGTNKIVLDNGQVLQAKYPFNRKIDEASLIPVLENLPEGTEQRLIRYKPELIFTEYRKLPDSHRYIFDQTLVIKPGTPSLSLIPPKE